MRTTAHHGTRNPFSGAKIGEAEAPRGVSPVHAIITLLRKVDRPTMKSQRISRADAIKAAAIPVVSLIALRLGASAEAATNNQAQFKYQTKPGPKGAKCSGCSLYKPNKNPKLDGACSAVTGSISPNGWCIAYAPKAK